jgi:DnaJ-class molecular chaperone
MARDLYQDLGVAKGADADTIRKSFRKLAKQLHPDQNPGDKAAEERFKKITGAFDILGDAEKKAKYDRGEIDADGREVHRGFGGSGFGGAGSAGYQSGPFGGFGGRGFEGPDLDEILANIMGRDGPRDASGPGRGFGGFAAKGADVRAKLAIDLEEAINGAKKRIAFSDGRTVEVTIPAGAQDGQTLRLKGQGAPMAASGSKPAGPPGDALIDISIRPHPTYRREDPASPDLSMDLPVTVYEAVLGAKVPAPTPDGPVTLTVPRHSSSGRVLKLRGKGAVHPAGGRGDLYAKLAVALPESDAELEAFAERWKTERPYDPRKR